MTITYRGVALPAWGITSPLTADIDAITGHAVNDLLLAHIVCRLNAGATIGGYTALANSLNTNPTPDVECLIRYKLDTGSEVDQAFTHTSPGNGYGVYLSAYSDIDTTDPFAATPITSTGLNKELIGPTITPDCDDAMILSFAVGATGTGIRLKSGSEAGFTPRASQPINIAYTHSSGPAATMGFAEKLITGGAGVPVTGPLWENVATPTQLNWALITVALRPLVSAPLVPSSRRARATIYTV